MLGTQKGPLAAPLSQHAPAVDEHGVPRLVHGERQRGRGAPPVHLLAVRLVALHRRVHVADALVRKEGAVGGRQAVQQVDHGAHAQAAQEGVRVGRGEAAAVHAGLHHAKELRDGVDGVARAQLHAAQGLGGRLQRGGEVGARGNGELGGLGRGRGGGVLLLEEGHHAERKVEAGLGVCHAQRRGENGCWREVAGLGVHQALVSPHMVSASAAAHTTGSTPSIGTLAQAAKSRVSS